MRDESGLFIEDLVVYLIHPEREREREREFIQDLVVYLIHPSIHPS
jgi:hypothetical protein